jgi:hypothetical protein
MTFVVVVVEGMMNWVVKNCSRPFGRLGVNLEEVGKKGFQQLEHLADLRLGLDKHSFVKDAHLEGELYYMDC